MRAVSTITCPHCGGSGGGQGVNSCPLCAGRGEVNLDEVSDWDEWHPEDIVITADEEEWDLDDVVTLTNVRPD